MSKLKLNWQPLKETAVELSPYGIRDIGICWDFIQGKTGFNVILYANDLLWGMIEAAPLFGYPERLVDIVQKVMAGLKTAINAELHYTICELVALADCDPKVAKDAGRQYENDTVFVPESNLMRLWAHTSSAMVDAMLESEHQTLMDSLDPWGRVLNGRKWFDAENSDHRVWITLAFVPAKPAREITHANCERAVGLTQLGWNFTEIVPAELDVFSDCVA